MTTAMDIYNSIGEEIDRRQSQLEDFAELAAYSDPKDGNRLRDLANQTRDMIAGLDLARSIAYPHAMTEKESS